MARKTRHTETNIRRELIAAELEWLRQERQGLLASNAELKQRLTFANGLLDKIAARIQADESSQLLTEFAVYCGQAELNAKKLDILRSLLHEFLSTHCAPPDLRERATAAVGKPPLEFAPGTASVRKKETKP